MTLDTEKAFTLVIYLFLITALENYVFKEDFFKQIQIPIKFQETCVINGGTTTNYFKLERGTRQGDPILGYLFILVLEIAFLLIIQKESINGLNILKKHFYTQRMQTILHFFLKAKHLQQSQ